MATPPNSSVLTYKGKWALSLHLEEVHYRLLTATCRMPSFDELLCRVGDFGPYQRRISILGCLPLALFPFVLVGVVFLGNSPQHWCRIEHAERIQGACSWTERELRQLTAPHGSSGSCQKFDVDWNTSMINCSSSNISQPSSLFAVTPERESCDHGWVFDSNHTSVVTEV